MDSRSCGILENVGADVAAAGKLNIRIHRTLIDNTAVSKYGVKIGEYAVISVEDTGTGIAEDKIEKIFEPFFTTKDIGKGSGLGLSISHGIIKAHGGFIDLQTEQGKGTTFCVYLPIAKDVNAKCDEETFLVKKTVHGNILIIDDDHEYVQMIKESLENEGFSTTTALSGKEAIDYYRDRINDVDIILLDMLMPEMNGTEVFSALKRLKQTKDLMANFYKKLLEGKPKETSLLEAKKEMIKEGLPPFYWAPFIFIGAN